MNDEELEELLRRTLRNRAASIGARASRGEAPELRLIDAPGASRRRPALYAATGLAAAAALALITTLALQSGHSTTSHVSISVPPASKASSVARSAAHAAPSTTYPIPTTTLPSLDLGPVPSGFDPQSVTFVSAYTGWVLGYYPCDTGECPALARTTNGGVSWTSSPVPGKVSASMEVRFADAEDGVIVTTEGSTSRIWATHDGGAEWYQATDPGGSVAYVYDVEASAGKFQAIVGSSAGGSFQIYSTPAGSDRWTLSSAAALSNVTGSGSAATGSVLTQMLLEGGGGWVADNGGSGSLASGATLSSNGTWTAWNLPCPVASLSAVPAASSASDLDVICNESGSSSSANPSTATAWLLHSDDSGRSFSSIGQVTGGEVVSATQPPGAASTVVAATTQGIYKSTDGGKTWVSASTVDAGFVGFTTANQGVAIVGESSASPNSVYMTRDGGSSWYQVHFS